MSTKYSDGLQYSETASTVLSSLQLELCFDIKFNTVKLTKTTLKYKKIVQQTNIDCSPMRRYAILYEEKKLFTGKMNLELKKRIMKCLVWSVADAAETWTLIQTCGRKLAAFEMWI